MKTPGLSWWRAFELMDKLLLTHAIASVGAAPLMTIFSKKNSIELVIVGLLLGFISVLGVIVIRLYDLDKPPPSPKKKVDGKLKRNLKKRS